MFLSISYNKSARLICGLLLLSCRIVDRGKKIEQNNHNSCFSCSLFGITSLKKTNFILVEMSSNVGKRQQQLSNLRFIQKAKREPKKDTERTVTKMETLKQSLSLYEHDAPAILFLLQLFFFRRRRRFLFYWAYNNIIRKMRMKRPSSRYSIVI